MAKGFVLIELLISIAISSIVMTVFVKAFNQVQKTAESLESTMSVDSKAALFQAILENDLSGAFTPSIQTLDFSGAALEEKVEKAFYEEKENDELSELSFITCNPLNPAINFKPRIARIFYFFRDDLENRGSKIFYRKQNRKEIEYDFAKDDDSYKYEVIDGIKGLKVEYVLEKSADEDENEEGVEEPSNKKKKPKFQEEKDGPDQVGTARRAYAVVKELDDEGEAGGRIPSFITITLQLWKDIKKGKWVEYVFKFKLYSANYHLSKLTMPKLDDGKDKKPPEQPPVPAQAGLGAGIEVDN